MKTPLNHTQEAHLRSVMGQGTTPPHINLNSKSGGGGFTLSQPPEWKKVFGGLAVPAPGYVRRNRRSGPNHVAK